MLREVDGVAVAPDLPQVTLTFEADKVSGSSGCNRYNGAVSQGETGTSLAIGPLATTRMACPEPIMAQEQALLDRLRTAKEFQFSVGDLV